MSEAVYVVDRAGDAPTITTTKYLATATNTARTQLARRFLLMSASVAALTVLSAAPAAAQWTGQTSSDWTDPTNWTSAVPGPAQAGNIDTVSPNPTVIGVNGPVSAASTNLVIGANATGRLTIQNGSTLTSTGGTVRIGFGAGSAGTVTVTGSQWDVTTSQLQVGSSGTGTLNIENGGQVNAQAAAGVAIGAISGSSGTVNVTGGGSQLNVTSGQLVVGNAGTGVLNIGNGGTVTAQAGIRIGAVAGSTGTLNIGNGGILETTGLTKGPGDVQVNFDGGTIRALQNSALFFPGFTAPFLNIAAGGLTFDTNGHSVTVTTFGGIGGLTVTGAGQLTIAGKIDSSYTGRTVIDSGSRLLLRGVGDIAASSRVTANGTFNVSGITAANANIQSLAGSGIVDMGTKSLTLTNAHDDIFSGTFVDGSGLTLLSGKETLTGNNSGFTGPTNVEGGTLAVNGSLGGVMNVNGGRLQGIGTVGDTILAAGATIAPGNSIGTLTVGNYTGNGGTLEIESALGGDASPSDKLVVTGNTAGSTNVKVINVGGAGAQTVEGIKVIDVQGASNGTFSLLGDYNFHGQQAVIAGAYAYMLEKNGVATPGDGDWYLRSALVNPPAAVPAGPIYQPGVPLYEALPRVLQAMNNLPTLQQRVGNRYWGGNVALLASGDQSSQPGVFWARTEGNYTRTNGGATYSSADIGQWSMRTGFDGLLYQNGDGMLLGGLTAHYGLATADIRSLYGDGRINTTAQGFGATATWYGATGFYVDSQAQVTIFDSTLKSDALGRDMARDNGALGYAFSVETGKRFGLNGPWSLTPQAQLIYSAIQNSFTDNFATNVSLNGNDRLTGRLGAALEHQRVWRDDAGKLTSANVYGIANVYYEFLSNTSVNVAGTTIGSDIGRTAAGFGFGGTYNWDNNKYAVYGEALVKTSFDDNYSVGGTAGFRVKW